MGADVQKILDYWRARNGAQRALLLAAFFATALGVGGFAILANRTDMALLYGGLDPAQAGAVMAEVEKTGVAYEVRGDSIWVDARARDRMRMDLAGKGLPSAGGVGYELLDGMSGFGTTSQMFDAAYWRAKEGELARTILALPNIKAARVHLAVATGRGYRREQSGTASVTLTTDGTAVTPAQAKSLKFLISSGVAGLSPEAVTVIDSARGVVQSGEDDAGAERERVIQKNVERILEAHVGPGNVIVEVNLDRVTESEQLVEQTFDPNGRVLISEEKEESEDQSSNANGGPVTVASNLPEQPSAAGDQSRSARSETRNRANYEVSHQRREVVRKPGALRRQTVAVLVNGTPQKGADGETRFAPRSDDELKVLRDLVASAVGYDESRGDEITVKSLVFQAEAEAGTLATEGGWMARLAVNDLARLGLIGLFTVLFGALVLRPMLRRNSPAPAALDDSGPVQGASLPAPEGAADLPALTMAEPPLATDAGFPALEMAQPEFSFDPAPADPVARLKEMMKTRQDESMQILSGWIGKGGAA